ncbi:MAG: TusE/DsrC/DsvC family sulfur relay protein [Granulosicoccaceae bacterium]|jgi:tRNA 2-thiouridine synthesizing protein E
MTYAKQYEQGLAFDEYGLITNPRAWNDSVARQIARRHGIRRLTEEHWQVIDALRDHYMQYGVAPAMNSVCRAAGHDRFWVHDLFGSCLNAWRVAGLPNPGEEAKSYLSDM